MRLRETKDSKGTTVKNRGDNLMPLFPHTVLGTGQRLRVMLGPEQTAMAGRWKQAGLGQLDQQLNET